MLVKVLTPNRMAHGMLLRVVFQLISDGALQHLYDCTMNTVAVFCSSTRPPLNGMFKTIALLRMIMVTETVVDAIHAAATVDGGMVCSAFGGGLSCRVIRTFSGSVSVCI